MQELFYSMDDTVVALDINAGVRPLEWSAAKHLFRIPNFTMAPVRGLTVSDDGQRFFAIVPKAAADPQRLTTILNWAALLK